MSTITTNNNVTVLINAVKNWVTGAKVIPQNGPIGPIGMTGPIGIAGPVGMTGPVGLVGGGMTFISSGAIGAIGGGGGGGVSWGSLLSSPYYTHNATQKLYDKTLNDFKEIEITDESSATIQEINGRLVVSLYMSIEVEGIIGIKDNTIVSVDEKDSDPYFVIVENNWIIYITNGEKYYLLQNNVEKTLTKDVVALINGVIQQYKNHLRKHFE